jgi:hypothetical protein
MEQCKEFVAYTSKAFASKLPCENKVWKDGWCKIHHPDNQARLEKGKRERFEKRIREENLRKAQYVASNYMSEARKEAGLLTLEEARALGAKI